MKISRNRKAILATIAISVVFMIFSACKKQAEPNTQAPTQVQTQTETQTEQNILIAYFSHSGNTKAVAQHIQSFVGGNLAEIKTEKAYTDDQDALLAQARKELSDNFRPALAYKIENLENYDVVFVGFPIWFSSVPMVILTFLETHDLSNKTVIPFSTRGGGNIGESGERIREALPNSIVLDGFHDINRANFSQARELTENWVKSAGY
jgi:flavodoxin